MMDLEALQQALATFLGSVRYRKFVLETRPRGGLRYWQEQEWRRFTASHPEFAVGEDPLEDAVRICELHGPRKPPQQVLQFCPSLACSGDVYLIPLLQGKQALATVLGVGSAPWNRHLAVMLVGAHNCIITGAPPTDSPPALIARYWCCCSFIEEGNWSLVKPGTTGPFGPASSANPVWGTHELFLDDLRQHLGLERQTYKRAEFTFSTNCKACGACLHQGLARCPQCRAIRIEFDGLEQFVSDQLGCCCLSGAVSDVRDENGNYYWAPYFIDRIRAGEVPQAHTG